MTRVLGRAALCVLLPLSVLVGCGGGDDPDPDTATSPSSPESSATTSEPTDDPTTQAPPGPVLELLSARVTAPEGWKIDRDSTEINIDANPPGSSSSFISFYDFGPVPGLTLRQFIMSAQDNFAVPRAEQTLSADVELGGTPGYRLTGSASGSETRYTEYGAVHQGMAVSLSFVLSTREYTPDQEQALMDEALATFEWK